MSQPGQQEIMATSMINNKYRITRRIGGGSFGEIYLGIGPAGEKVAVKFERHGTRCPQLRHEYKVYRELASCHGFCKVHHFGTQDNYNVMVMDLLGPSLEDLFNRCARRFSLKTVLQLADHMLERVDTLHARHLIHRDIKPANFVIGLGDQGNITFCVDFGLSKRYRHPKTLQHIPHRDGRSLTGTPRYASINNHLGIEQSRRDDLESIGYVLVYFLKGSLPWQGLKAKNAQKKYRLILEKKQQVSIAQLCQGCPSQFAEFLAYTRSLKFDAKPDIAYLRKLFRDLYIAQGCNTPGKMWDWDSMDLEHAVGSVTSGAANELGSGNARLDVDIDNMDIGVTGEADYRYDTLGGASGGIRPGTSGAAVPSRPTTSGAVLAASGPVAAGVPRPSQASWGFASRPGTSDQPLGSGQPGVLGSGARPQNTYENYTSSNPVRKMESTPAMAVPAAVLPSTTTPSANAAGNILSTSAAQKRPHTAHGPRGVVPVPTAEAAGGRKPSSSGLDVDDGGEDDPHVVAGARAMMRYRRTKPEPTVPSTSAPDNRYTAGSPWGYSGTLPTSGTATPTSSIPPVGSASGGRNLVGTKAIYQNPNAVKAAPTTPGNSGPPASSFARKTPIAPAAGNGGGGWNGSSNPVSADTRPKSAGVAVGAGSGGVIASAAPRAGVTSMLGARPGTSGGKDGSGGVTATPTPPAGTTPPANNNTLLYGSLKNRFLSGSKSKTGSTTGTGSAKLFSLSR